MITIDDFKKLDIRIGEVKSAERVPNADKFIKFIFDLGPEFGDRQVLAGIAEQYPDPSVLVGRKMPVLINIEPRVLRGETSHGMILAAGGPDRSVGKGNNHFTPLSPMEDVPAGSIVR